MNTSDGVLAWGGLIDGKRFLVFIIVFLISFLQKFLKFGNELNRIGVTSWTYWMDQASILI